MKCLMIDDFQEHIDTILQHLQMYDCGEVKGTTSAREGLEIISEWKPDLILVDDLMQGKRAWQIALEMRRQNPNYRPYMVSLCAFATALQKRLCEENGYDEYVSKPFELGTLLGWVKKARERSENAGRNNTVLTFEDILTDRVYPKESPADKKAKQHYRKAKK